MKVFVVVALFAFVAVQLTQAAPAPDEEKKEEVVSAASVVVVSSPAPPVTVEVKSENPDVSGAPAVAVVEEKKP